MGTNNQRSFNIVGYLLDYGPIVITVVAATAASIFAIRTDTSAEELLQWVIIVLGFLATTQLIDKFRTLRKIESKLDELANQQRLGAEEFFKKDFIDLQERIANESSVAINGITLVRTSNTFLVSFRRCLRNGGQVRILITDPEHPAIQIAAARFEKHQNFEKIQSECRLSLDNFEALARDKDLGKRFKVGLAPISPAFGIWLIDAGTPKAEIWAELYGFRAEHDPVIHLLPYRDGSWFEYFQKQFESMWSTSKQWKPDNAVQALPKN